MSQQNKLEVIEHPARVGTGFDLRTHILDAKTGEMIRIQPYRRFCEGRSVYFERPKMSGNLFYESNEPAGRRIQDKDGNWIIDTKLEHVDFIAPKTHLVKAQEVFEENAALRAELAALKAEKDAKLESVKAPTQVAAPQQKKA